MVEAMTEGTVQGEGHKIRGRKGEVMTDGRHLRREKGRRAVVDAVVDLTLAHHAFPNVDEVAAEAGVSVSSIFRYFKGLEDLQEEAFDRFVERFSHMLNLPVLTGARLDDRIAALVKSRAELCQEVGYMAELMTVRAADRPDVARRLQRIRQDFVGQLRVLFAPEVAQMTPAVADDFVISVEVLVSPSAWRSMTVMHGRSAVQIRRSWTRSVHGLVTGFSAQ